MNYAWNTAQKMKFYVKFYENKLFGKCDQIRRFLRIWSHLSEEMLNGELHFFCAVERQRRSWLCHHMC